MPRRNHFRQAQLRRYRSQRYRNPHLEHRQRLPWRPIAGGIAITFALISLVSFFLGHSLFQIARVEVHGIEFLDHSRFESSIREYLDERRFFFFTRSNRFLFRGDQLMEGLQSQFALAEVTVSLQEETIFIQLQERTSNLFWKIEDRLFVVDLEGVIVREVVDDSDVLLQQFSASQLPLFIDVNNTLLEIGDTVLTSDEVENAFAFLDHLEDRGIQLDYVSVDRIAGKWVNVLTKTGFYVLVDLTGDIDEQSENLRILLDEQIEDASALEYIDLRFGDKVYYK